MASSTPRINLPKPHAGQQRVIDQARRFNVLACGRRWGKTVLGCDRLVWPALDCRPVGWFAPTYKSLSESWREVKTVLSPVTAGVNTAEHRLDLVTGGSVTMWSLDGGTEGTADLCRGRRYARIVVDEAAMVPSLIDIWDRVIRPTLADYRGDAWFLSTPRGMNGFKVLYDRGQDPERPTWASWRMPTSTNPHIHPDELAEAKKDMSELAYAQEFDAEFVNWEGAIFRRIADAATAELLDGPEDNHEYIIGVDWGRSTDFTVFIVLDLTHRKMVAMERSNKLDYTVQRGRLKALYERWRPLRIIAEQNSIGQPIIETLRREGLPVRPFITTNASKANAVEALALAFERGDIRILNDAVLMSELQGFQAEPLPSGMMRYSAPAGGHDDTVMALAIAWAAVGGSMKIARPNIRLFGTPQPIGHRFTVPINP